MAWHDPTKWADMLTPDGERRWVPIEEVSQAISEGGYKPYDRVPMWETKVIPAPELKAGRRGFEPPRTVRELIDVAPENVEAAQKEGGLVRATPQEVQLWEDQQQRPITTAAEGVTAAGVGFVNTAFAGLPKQTLNTLSANPRLPEVPKPENWQALQEQGLAGPEQQLMQKEAADTIAEARAQQAARGPQPPNAADAALGFVQDLEQRHPTMTGLGAAGAMIAPTPLGKLGSMAGGAARAEVAGSQLAAKLAESGPVGRALAAGLGHGAGGAAEMAAMEAAQAPARLSSQPLGRDAFLSEISTVGIGTALGGLAGGLVGSLTQLVRGSTAKDLLAELAGSDMAKLRTDEEVRRYIDQYATDLDTATKHAIKSHRVVEDPAVKALREGEDELRRRADLYDRLGAGQAADKEAKVDLIDARQKAVGDLLPRRLQVGVRSTEYQQPGEPLMSVPQDTASWAKGAPEPEPLPGPVERPGLPYASAEKSAYPSTILEQQRVNSLTGGLNPQDTRDILRERGLPWRIKGADGTWREIPVQERMRMAYGDAEAAPLAGPSTPIHPEVAALPKGGTGELPVGRPGPPPLYLKHPEKITPDMVDGLKAMGASDAEIAKMKPDEAWAFLHPPPKNLPPGEIPTGGTMAGPTPDLTRTMPLPAGEVAPVVAARQKLMGKSPRETVRVALSMHDPSAPNAAADLADSALEAVANGQAKTIPQIIERADMVAKELRAQAEAMLKKIRPPRGVAKTRPAVSNDPDLYFKQLVEGEAIAPGTVPTTKANGDLAVKAADAFKASDAISQSVTKAREIESRIGFFDQNLETKQGFEAEAGYRRGQVADLGRQRAGVQADLAMESALNPLQFGPNMRPSPEDFMAARRAEWTPGGMPNQSPMTSAIDSRVKYTPSAEPGQAPLGRAARLARSTTKVLAWGAGATLAGGIVHPLVPVVGGIGAFLASHVMARGASSAAGRLFDRGVQFTRGISDKIGDLFSRSETVVKAAKPAEIKPLPAPPARQTTSLLDQIAPPQSGSPTGKVARTLAGTITEYSQAVSAAAANPDNTEQRIRQVLRPISIVDPDLYEQTVTGIMQRIEFLNEKMPKNPDAGTLAGRVMRWAPNDVEASKAARYIRAADDPAGALLGELKSGLVNPETIETVQTLYPDLFDHIQQGVLQRVMDVKDLSYPYRVAVSKVFGIGLEPSLDPTVANGILSLQQSEAKDQDTNKRGGYMASSRKINMKSATTATPAQRQGN